MKTYTITISVEAKSKKIVEGYISDISELPDNMENFKLVEVKNN